MNRLAALAALAATSLIAGCINPCGDMCEGFYGSIDAGSYEVIDASGALPEGWSWESVELTPTQSDVIIRFTDADGNSHEAVYEMTYSE